MAETSQASIEKKTVNGDHLVLKNSSLVYISQLDSVNATERKQSVGKDQVVITNNSKATASAVDPNAIPSKRVRNGFLDGLKLLLTQQVIFHHAFTFTYFGFPYVLPQIIADFGSVAFSQFLYIFNQCYFMALFFFISGLFVVGSYNRKGPKEFMKDRCIRLLSPIFIYIVLLTPIPIAIVQHRFRIDGPHHIWFIILLFVFNLVFVCLRLAIPKCDAHFMQQKYIQAQYASAFKISNRDMTKLLVAAYLVLFTVSFIVRIGAPVGLWLPVLGQVAYVPQYAVAFTAGVYSDRYNFLGRMPTTRGWLWTTGLLSFLIFFGGFGSVFLLMRDRIKFTTSSSNVGGVSDLNVIFAGIEMIFFVFISYYWLILFKRLIPDDLTSPLAKELIVDSYAAYIFHYTILVLVLVGLLQVWPKPNIGVFFALAGFMIATPLTWTFAAMIRRVPGVKQVLA